MSSLPYEERILAARSFAAMRATWFALMLSLAAVGAASGQTATIRGFITDAANREPLQGVNVVLDDFEGVLVGAVTDGNGFFLASRLRPGAYRVQTSFIGYETFVDTVELSPGERMLLNIELREDPLELGEISVEAERETGAARVTAGMESVRPEDIETIPAPDVSGDLISYLSAMPGVVLMGDRGGQVFIRGGEPSHNLTMLDGMDVYQPFHILGFYSAFPSEIINRADVYSGGFGTRYTRRLSSVIDVQTRNGNKRRFSGAASISPFAGSARLEGPIIPNRISFLGAARTSLLDQIASEYVGVPLPYRFSDMFGKMHAHFAQYQFAFSGLRTYDRGTLSSEDDPFQLNDQIRWRNTAYGVRYLVAPTLAPLLGEVLVSYSDVLTELGPEEEPTRSSLFKSVNLSANLTHFSPRMKVDWGFHFRAPTLQVELDGFFQEFTAGLYRALHVGAYVEPDFYVGRGIHMRPGLSFQSYGDEGVDVDPRLRLRMERGIHHWSAAAGLYRQEIIGISDRRDATNIFTAWVGTPTGNTATALHALLGYRVTPTRWLEISIEGFYKQLYNLPINEWTAFPGFTTRLQEADGRAAGFDLRLEVRRPRYYLLVNYGLSSTRYDVGPVAPGLPDPEPFRPPHDRRHQVNLIGDVTLAGFDLSVRWQFGSGLPYTQIRGFDGFILMNGAVDVERVRGLPRVIYDEKPYRAVLPVYHRLDVSVERKFAPVPGVDLTLHAGALNVYDRANLFTLDLFTAQRSDQLPFVPVAGLKVEL